MMSYRTDDIEFEMVSEGNRQYLVLTVPKFSALTIYHATNGVDFMKKNERGQTLTAGSLPVGTKIDKAILKIEVIDVKLKEAEG